MRHRYTKELLAKLARESFSIAAILRKLGLAEAGGSHSHISRKLEEYQIDTSHFLGCRANSGSSHKGSCKTPARELLVLRATGRRQKAHRLRRALLESGRDYRCEGAGCFVVEEWRGRPLVLQINHKNENWLDDREENLEFLCPNCHSQTPNYCGSKGLSDRTSLARQCRVYRQKKKRGPVAELADACGLGPQARKGVRVRVPPGPSPSSLCPT